MSRPRPPARRKPPVTPDRRHRTPVKVKVRASPRIPVWTWGVAGAAVLAAVVFVAAQAMNSSNGGPTYPNAPLLTPVDTAATGATVAGIECGSHEESLFHIHAHLAVMVDASPRDIPQGIGIAPTREAVQTSGSPDVVSAKSFY